WKNNGGGFRSPAAVSAELRAALEQVEVVLNLRVQHVLTLEQAQSTRVFLVAAQHFDRAQLEEVLLRPGRIQRQRREQGEGAAARIKDHGPVRHDIRPEPARAEAEQRLHAVLRLLARDRIAETAEFAVV